MALRRESFDINKKVVDYTNGISAFLDLDADAARLASRAQAPRLSLMEPFPELGVLDAKIERKLERLRLEQTEQFAQLDAKLEQLLTRFLT